MTSNMVPTPLPHNTYPRYGKEGQDIHLMDGAEPMGAGDYQRNMYNNADHMAGHEPHLPGDDFNIEERGEIEGGNDDDGNYINRPYHNVMHYHTLSTDPADFHPQPHHVTGAYPGHLVLVRTLVTDPLDRLYTPILWRVIGLTRNIKYSITDLSLEKVKRS